MQVAVIRERKAREQRVALTPDSAKALVKLGHTVVVETGAGEAAGFPDEAYLQAGASIGASPEAILPQAGLLLKVNEPLPGETEALPADALAISFLYAYTKPDLVQHLQARRISALAMDAVPRITRAQNMDALSSQANLAGYKAVLLGAGALKKIFPLMMTAAGTITPARVLIFGAGVAGLQAIATARRLGAVVEVTDVRPETKEQVESLGGRFLEVDSAEAVKVEGGYAKEVSAEFLQKQQELIRQRIREADLVITTALVMGRKAPVLVTADMVATMKPGSVIVDMAVESGGNCELSVPDQTVAHHGVTIIGESNLPALLARDASELYARNLVNLIKHMTTKEGFALNPDDEIVKGCLITHQGQLVHAFTREKLQPA